jgi:hypothetical protein
MLQPLPPTFSDKRYIPIDGITRRPKSIFPVDPMAKLLTVFDRFKKTTERLRAERGQS